ncbi:MAG: signal peptidase [Solirubrobacteraceae bacterium]|jgi:signal peptidase II|nr:signal peptidase [Solirubrobacteraceae bacterium]
MTRAWGRAGLVVLVVVLLDQITKALVVADVGRGERRDLFAGIDLVHVRNKGIAFGLFDRGGTVLTVVTLAALVLLLVYFALHASRPWLWLPTGLLLGGAIGNLIDRAREGAVTDFLDPPLWPAFNVADMSITIGVVALLLALDAARSDE